jgi:hypothetical protein
MEDALIIPQPGYRKMFNYEAYQASRVENWKEVNRRATGNKSGRIEYPPALILAAR